MEIVYPLEDFPGNIPNHLLRKSIFYLSATATRDSKRLMRKLYLLFSFIAITKSLVNGENKQIDFVNRVVLPLQLIDDNFINEVKQ